MAAGEGAGAADIERHEAGLAPLLDTVRARLAEDWPLERLAAEAALSLRSLHRRFREATGLAPGEWLLAERPARAQELLEGSALPVEAVAEQVGFGTAATLRLHFRARFGVSPAS